MDREQFTTAMRDFTTRTGLTPNVVIMSTSTWRDLLKLCNNDVNYDYTHDTYAGHNYYVMGCRVVLEDPDPNDLAPLPLFDFSRESDDRVEVDHDASASSMLHAVLRELEKSCALDTDRRYDATVRTMVAIRKYLGLGGRQTKPVPTTSTRTRVVQL